MNDKFREFGIGKYQKNMKNIFDILMKKGNPRLAIRYAKRMIREGQGKTPAETAPGTKVYELVEEFVKYLPEDGTPRQEIRKDCLRMQSYQAAAKKDTFLVMTGHYTQCSCHL